MSQRPSFYVLAGGLDQTTQALAVPKGRCIACKNHESVAGGYARVGGFERYDGRQSPTDAYNLALEGQEAIDREVARAAIGPVPGSGSVRGIASYLGVRYAWRDNAGGTAGVMHKATATGWVAVDLGYSVDFTSGGATEIEEGDTITGAVSGATATVKAVVKTGGTWADGDAVGYLVLSDVVGVFQAENLNVNGVDLATIAAAPAAQTFPAGGRYYTKNHNFYGASFLKRMYGCNGVGRGFEFDGETMVFIRTGMVDDKPMRVSVFKQHLFFGFAGGSGQHSETGAPRQWSAVLGAGEIAVGSEIVDFVSSVNALHILTVDQINTLMGSDASDWVMEPLSYEEGHGAIAHTAQTVGAPLYMDVGGLRSISVTQQFGNFKLGALVNQIGPTILAKRRAGVFPVASVVAKAKDQYRVFYEDGTGISVYFGRKYAEPMVFDLGKVMTCICSELDADTGERLFFGADDGYVYELDVGTSFDGEVIEAFLQLPWDHEGSPWTLKRWHKAILEMDANPETQIGMMAEFDYGNEEQGTLPQQDFTVSGGGGLWDASNWDEFYWSSPAEGQAECYLDGQGKNMSLTIVSTSAEQLGYTLAGVTKMVSVRGQAR